MKYWINALFIASIAGHLSVCVGAEDFYYRYKDKDGNTVISNTIPSEFANQGYDLIYKNGDLAETVPPKKNGAEISKEEAQKKEMTIKRTKEEEQQRQDEILLKSYGSEKDIERARDEKIASIKILEDIMQENLHGLNKQLSDIKESMEQYKQQNKPVPQTLQKTLDDTLRQIKDNETFLTKKTIEKKDIQDKYEVIINHYKALKNQENSASTSDSSKEPQPAQPVQPQPQPQPKK